MGEYSEGAFGVVYLCTPEASSTVNGSINERKQQSLRVQG